MAWFQGLDVMFLGVLFGMQCSSRPLFRKFIGWLWGGAFLIFGAASGYAAWRQYAAWRAGAGSRFLLPPYQSIGYFLSYVGTRIFAPWLIALAAGILLSRLLAAFNRRFGERFFESEEMPLFGAAVFLTGYPGFLLYIPLVLFAGACLSVFYTLRRRGRAPLYFLWIPVGIFVILFMYFLLIPAGMLNGFIL